MRILATLGVLLAVCACSTGGTVDTVYLKHKTTGEIIKCEAGVVDKIVDTVEICAANKEDKGFERINVKRFDYKGIPVEYDVEKDPFWPKRN